MREAPGWFQSELTRIGGVNPYDEPVFRLAWSNDTRQIIGGKWSKDGYEGYREAKLVNGTPCWCLLVWESPESFGTASRWEDDYRDAETGYLICGGFPASGRYRLLRRFLHSEIVEQAQERHWLDGNKLRREVTGRLQMKEYRMEPCGLMLDLMLPMLLMWRRMSDEQKLKAHEEEESLKAKDRAAVLKDVYKSCRVNRGSRLVQKRAEIIEKGLAQSIKIASQYGLGMQVER